MRDFAATYRSQRVTANKVKVRRNPLNLARYLRLLGRMTVAFACVALLAVMLLTGRRMLSRITPFRLKTIAVSSGAHISQEEIISITGAGPGRDLLRMDLKVAAEQLLKNPWVESVRIRRYLPDALSIDVTERKPVAAVNVGYLCYLDSGGNIFKVVNQGERLDYPVVTGFSEDDLNNDPAGSREALKTICELLAILREKGAFILADVSEIHYDKGYGFTLFTASCGLPVKVGAGDFSAKISRFARIYRELMAQRGSIQYIDLDYNDRIVVRKS
jgi:cell division septal protein FtsQ